jgi:hypothetical protein
MAAAFAAVLPAPDTNVREPLAEVVPVPVVEMPLPVPRPDPTNAALDVVEPVPRTAIGTTRLDVRTATPQQLDAAFALVVRATPTAGAVTELVIGDPFDIAPPISLRNPIVTGEIDVAAIPDGGFTPSPLPQHDQTCLSQLAALPLEAAPLPPLVGDNSCGIHTPLEIESIGAGRFAVELTPAALVDCSVAGALSQWLEEDVQPAARSILGEWVSGVRIAASYACRGRNNDPAAPLSEHAFGNAVDISAFRLADGTWVEVQPFADLSEPTAEFLAAIRSEACGPFTTVLGPGVAFHDDHFHLNLAARGQSGRRLYCP